MDASIAALVVEGLRLMAIGMSIVFLFLLLLVGVLTLMSRLIIRYAPPAPAPLVAGGEPLPSGGGARDEELVVVISAAVAKYRAAHRSP